MISETAIDWFHAGAHRQYRIFLRVKARPAGGLWGRWCRSRVIGGHMVYKFRPTRRACGQPGEDNPWRPRGTLGPRSLNVERGSTLPRQPPTATASMSPTTATPIDAQPITSLRFHHAATATPAPACRSSCFGSCRREYCGQSV